MLNISQSDPVSHHQQPFRLPPFNFTHAPSFSRLRRQLPVCSQRSTAPSQVPAGTTARAFTHHTDPRLQMWPFSNCFKQPLSNPLSHCMTALSYFESFHRILKTFLEDLLVHPNKSVLFLSLSVFIKQKNTLASHLF